MENIKNFLGESYHDGITVEDIDKFLEGKKYVDLTSGNYVSKDKYETLLQKSNENNEKLKDYDSIKQKYDEYVEKERITNLTKLATDAGIRPEFVEFAISKVGEQEDMTAAFKKFAKENKQFTNQRIVIKTDSNPSLSDEKEQETINDYMNKQIREAAGYTSE